MSGHTPLPATPIDLPLLPLRDVVVFPHMVIPLFVGRPKSIKALETAMEADRKIMLVAQKTAAKDDPSVADMFGVGCVSTILQMLKLPDGTVKVLVEGVQRAQVVEIAEGEEYFTAKVAPVEPGDAAEKASEIEALRRAVMQQFDQYVKLNKKIPSEILTSIAGLEDAGRLADTIAAHLPLKLENKQAVLELQNVQDRLENLYDQLTQHRDHHHTQCGSQRRQGAHQKEPGYLRKADHQDGVEKNGAPGHCIRGMPLRAFQQSGQRTQADGSFHRHPKSQRQCWCRDCGAPQQLRAQRPAGGSD